MGKLSWYLANKGFQGLDKARRPQRVTELQQLQVRKDVLILQRYVA